jgi:hypothetical protein
VAVHLPSPLEVRLAARYLKRRGRRLSFSLNTVIATTGVAIGVMALIVVLGVMNGLRDELRDRILVANPDLRVLSYGQSLRLDPWRGDGHHHSEPGVVCRSRSAASRDAQQRGLCRRSAWWGSADTGQRVTDLPRSIRQRTPSGQPGRTSMAASSSATGWPAGCQPTLATWSNWSPRHQPGQRRPGHGGAQILAVQGDRDVRHQDVPVR